MQREEGNVRVGLKGGIRLRHAGQASYEGIENRTGRVEDGGVAMARKLHVATREGASNLTSSMCK